RRKLERLRQGRLSRRGICGLNRSVSVAWGYFSGGTAGEQPYQANEHSPSVAGTARGLSMIGIGNTGRLLQRRASQRELTSTALTHDRSPRLARLFRKASGHLAEMRSWIPGRNRMMDRTNNWLRAWSVIGWCYADFRRARIVI